MSHKPRAVIETDHTTGAIRVTLPGMALEGDVPRIQIDGITGRPHPDDHPVTPEQWAHLERACASRSGTPVFEVEELRSQAVGVRESAAQALAWRGYLTMYRVKVNSRDAGWAAVPTEAGRAALREYLAVRRGEAQRGASAH